MAVIVRETVKNYVSGPASKNDQIFSILFLLPDSAEKAGLVFIWLNYVSLAPWCP